MRTKSACGGVATLVGCLLIVAANAAQAGNRTRTVRVDLGTNAGEFTIRLTPSTVAVGTVNFRVTNHGSGNRDFKVCASSNGGFADSCAGWGTAPIAPQHSALLTITFKKRGVHEVLCTCQNVYLGAHGQARGLRGDLTVR
jgi:plastocyanin